MQQLTLIYLIFSYLIINISSELCNYNAKKKYSDLIIKFPELTNEFNIMSNYPIPIWYTDKNPYSLDEIKTTLQNCDQKLTTIIIYGLPNKDCGSGESSGGTNKNTNDYTNFINKLHKEVNNKDVIYIIEPDAIGLSIDNQCGIQNNYINHMKIALDILSQNKNANIYIDIGYWTLIYGDQKIKDIINIINDINGKSSNKKIKGFSLNLSNYRNNAETINTCQKLRDIGNHKYTCIIDTSRNANGPDNKNTWCNAKNAGIGNIPTNKTDNNIIDYFMWLKPAIEVDGHCYNFPESFHSKESAGGSDPEYFKILWNNGLLKNSQNTNYKKNENNEENYNNKKKNNTLSCN